MNSYRELVASYARWFQEGKNFPLGGFESVAVQPRVDAPTALIFSPHPDDEGIIGGLALRLLREDGWRIANVAVTQGSKKSRQSERLAELQNACGYLGFDLIQTGPHGLERVNPQTRQSDPAFWAQSVAAIARILAENKPAAIFFPHDADWNSSHIGTHWLVMDALATLGPDFSTALVETEYWGAMAAPNLMVELKEADVADLVTEVSFHVGEVRRNPFHLLLPAWMQDNVRRGSEVVGGQGQAAPSFGFATLYRLQWWTQGRIWKTQRAGRYLSATERPSSLFS
ncbi:MAG TPA: PIG-L family deacetylase [Candidatus Limnocylindria bacterium]|jgi:LmbE family N-acetylglucosaminyl deacetylase|nr:PIG-L family deacetylase [Candidatus Limnocylindria bacterium]